MRKPRNKPEEQKPEQEPQSKHVKEPPVWDTAHLHSFKQQAIEVLNYLDSIGEGIYDEGRYGGMYLHQSPGGRIPTKLARAIKEETRKKNQESQQEEQPEQQSDDLFKKMFGKS